MIVSIIACMHAYIHTRVLYMANIF